jgi:hypothetical protein
LAQGEYLTWTSDDNRYRPEALETMLRTLKEKQVALAFAYYQVIDEHDQEIQVIGFSSGDKGHVLGGNIVGACFLYTREVYETIGEYDTELFLVEDWDYWQRVLAKFPFCSITQVLYDYRLHSASLTSTKNNVRFGEVCEKMLLKNRPSFEKLNLQEKGRTFSLVTLWLGLFRLWFQRIEGLLKRKEAEPPVSQTQHFFD